MVVYFKVNPRLPRTLAHPYHREEGTRWDGCAPAKKGARSLQSQARTGRLMNSSISAFSPPRAKLPNVIKNIYLLLF